MAETIKIGGELESTATGNVVAAASAIKDKIKNKYQSEINNDVARHENEIHGTGGIDSRLDDLEAMEQIVIDGGDAQIATGSDFTNPDATKRAKVPTVGAVLDGLNDGVYDVSKRNPTGGENGDGKFTLAYILANADTLIPVSWRHGGMTISFVDSSDNKYVQYRLTNQSWSINVEDWQEIGSAEFLTGEKVSETGIDDTPTSDSDNLVKSGGVYEEINRLSDKIDSNSDKISVLENTSFIDNLTVVRKSEFNLVNPEYLEIGSVLKNDGSKQAGFGTQFAISGYIFVNGQNISCNAFAGSAIYSSYHVFGKTKNFLRSEYGTTLYQYQEGDYFIRFTISYDNNIENCRANYGNTLLEYKEYNPIYNYLSKYIEIIDALQSNIVNKTKLLGFLFNTEIVPIQVTNNYVNKNGSLSTWSQQCAFINVSQKQGSFLLFYKDLYYDGTSYISVAFYSCDNIGDIGTSTFMKGDNLSFRDTLYQIPTGAKWMLLSGKQFDSSSDINDFARWQSDSIDDYNVLEASEKKKIVCYGDSLTYGVGSTDNHNYPAILQNLINDNKHYSIINDGQPSAISFDIAARQGGIPYQIKSDIILPADTSSVSVEVNNDFIPTHTSSVFLKNMDCVVAGIQCTFDNTGKLHRKTVSDNSKTIYAKTPIVLNKSVEYSKAHVQIFFSGTNGSATSVENYVEQIERMVDYLDNKNFLIIGIVVYPGFSDSDRENVEVALTKRFGSKFINWRHYLLTAALGDAGITPTEADLAAIAEGNNPPSLLSDPDTYKIHYNNTGYELLANLVYQRMLVLGYLD